MRVLRGLVALWLAATCMTVLAQTQVLPDFTRLVEEQGSAVVNISTTQAVRRTSALPQIPGMEDDEIQEFFRRFIPRQQPGVPGPGPGPRSESRSLGSGFILSADGYIMTNAHVLEGADEINVRFTDKREFKAKVMGADKRTDVALIKIEASGLPAVRFGDPSKLKVGEWVVAIGAPVGFENSVTAGIVSAKGRSLPQENFVPFIQTDVAINPGNSGGPLFNMKGEVVGINSQIYSRTGGFMGLSFAIPIDVAMEGQNQLRQFGRVSRGRIGGVIQEVSKELAESRSEEHTSELQSRLHLVCRLLLEKKKKTNRARLCTSVISKEIVIVGPVGKNVGTPGSNLVLGRSAKNTDLMSVHDRLRESAGQAV